LIFIFCAAKEKLEIVSGAASPPFRIFAGGLPRRRRRRNAFGLIQEYCTLYPYTKQAKLDTEKVACCGVRVYTLCRFDIITIGS